MVEECIEELDIGDSEVIALALETDAELLLFRRKDARRVAKKRGLQRTGVVGVLREANDRGLIGEIRPLIEKLRN